MRRKELFVNAMVVEEGSESPQATALLAQRVDQERGHEETNGDTDGDLYHLRGNVEADGVEAVRGVLVLVSKEQRASSLGGKSLRVRYLRLG